MWKYLKAAFWVRPPGLGGLPVNALAALGCAALGFFNPGFWLLGLGLQLVVLLGLGLNPRFQALVNGMELARRAGDADRHRRALASRLSYHDQVRFSQLQRRTRQALEVARAGQAPEFVIETHRERLSRLEWAFLQLLVLRQGLPAPTAGAGSAGREQRERKAAEIETALQGLEQQVEAAIEQAGRATLDLWSLDLGAAAPLLGESPPATPSQPETEPPSPDLETET